jgi:UDP:flavonoid glycosyltransferase YjiC (YdhE family)
MPHYASSARTTGHDIGTSPTQLAAFDINRDYITIQNTEGVLYVRLGGVASCSTYTYRINKNATLELDWKGVISAVREAGAGYVSITELL